MARVRVTVRVRVAVAVMGAGLGRRRGHACYSLHHTILHLWGIRHRLPQPTAGVRAAMHAGVRAAMHACPYPALGDAHEGCLTLTLTLTLVSAMARATGRVID